MLQQLYGLLGASFYIFCFGLAVTFPTLKWEFMIPGAALGGIGAGIIWTAQGMYFASSSMLYAKAHNLQPEHVHASFAAIFAASYLGIETVMKLMATAVYVGQDGSKYTAPLLFLVYSIIALVASLAIRFISSLGDDGDGTMDTKEILQAVQGTARLLWSEPRIQLLLPYQLMFGFVQAFVPYYVDGSACFPLSSACCEEGVRTLTFMVFLVC